MQINKFQKIIISLYAVSIIFLCVLFVPQKVYLYQGLSKINYPTQIYKPIWYTSHNALKDRVIKYDKTITAFVNAEVDYKQLKLELFCDTVIFATLFILISKKKTQ